MLTRKLGQDTCVRLSRAVPIAFKCLAFAQFMKYIERLLKIKIEKTLLRNTLRDCGAIGQLEI